MRSYRLFGPEQPRVALYEHGKKLLHVPCSSQRQAAALGRAWADSDEPVPGITVEAV